MMTPRPDGLRLRNVPFVIERTLARALELTVDNVLPERLRYEVRRRLPAPSPRVLDEHPFGSLPEPTGARWHCPDPNYAWHWNVDDCGVAEHGDAAYEAAERHWREWHEGPWPGNAPAGKTV